MQTWVIITIVAAFLQNLRSVLQKHIKARTSVTGATFVRFGFGVPFALLFVALLSMGLRYPVPPLNAEFAGWVLIGGLSQIAAQALLIQMFSHRNFAVGTAYSRTEPAQAALFGLIFLGDRVSVQTLIAIAVSLSGVAMISVARSPAGPRALIQSVFSRTAGLGLASGTFFGVAAVAYRAASLSLGQPNFMMQAAMTLLATIVFQTVVMLAWMMWRQPGELARIRAAWKVAVLVGMVGATASFGWFMAMTLQASAVVKALAQIEMLFAFASSVMVFREHINRLEVIGCILVVAGILVLLIA